MMMRAGLFCAAILLLAGCEKDAEDARARISAQLPDGCEFRDLGYYKGSTVTAIICDQNASTTTRRVDRHYSEEMKATQEDPSFIGVVRK